MRPPCQPSRAEARAIPAEIVNVAGTAGLLLAVTVAGAAIAQALPDPASPWLQAAAYGGPAAVGLVLYGWLAQRL